MYKRKTDMKRIILLFGMALSLTTAVAQTEADFAPYAQRWDANEAQMRALGVEYDSLAKAVSDTAELHRKVKPIMQRAESLTDSRLALFWEIFDKFKQTKFPARYVESVMWYFNYDELAKVADPSTGFYYEKEMAMVHRRLQALALRKPGTMVKELTMAGLDGKTVRLTDYVGHGKYVLVDFWASWCGPCRQEMPNVVEAYRKYAGPKFEIVGVSFDSKADAWRTAVKSLGMTWPQMSDLKGWKSEGASVYGIQSIPSSVLFAPDGKVIDLDLRGEQLQQRLAELLGK